MTVSDPTTGQIERRESPGIAWAPTLLGGLAIVLGVLCFVVPKVSGLASVRYLGALLVASGVVEAAAAVRGDGHAQHRGVSIAGGLLAIAVGAIIVARPEAGMAALSLLLTAFFLGYGLFAAVTAIGSRYPNWSWEFAFGVALLAVGAISVALWPILALWVLGTLVGISIIARGATLLAFGLGMRDSPRRAAT